MLRCSISVFASGMKLVLLLRAEMIEHNANDGSSIQGKTEAYWQARTPSLSRLSRKLAKI